MTPSSSIGMAVSWRASWSVAWLLALREWLSGYRASRWNALWPLLYPVLYTALLLAVRPLLGQPAHDPAGYALFVIDCDSFGGLELGRKAVAMMAEAAGRVPVILVSR